MNKIDLDDLLSIATRYQKLAQTIETNTDLVDAIHKAIDQSITQIANDFLQKNAISSIQINIQYSKPQAVFEVDATGTDAEKVNTGLKSILDKKFSQIVAHIINTKDPKAPPFGFRLMTIE